MVNESKHQSSVLVVRAGLGVAVAAALAVGTAPVFATSTNTATISNGGLSVTFDLNWGAVVTGVANSNVDNGLNIVDSHDPGRELQTDEFLFDSTTTSRSTLVSNPTQAGSIVTSTGKYVGSPVISYSSSANQFQAVITPRDFNSGNVTDWVYVENVSINKQGIANFKYTCYDYVPQTYTMSTEIPTLYSDYTNNFMYPTCAAGLGVVRRIGREYAIGDEAAGDGKCGRGLLGNQGRTALGGADGHRELLRQYLAGH